MYTTPCLPYIRDCSRKFDGLSSFDPHNKTHKGTLSPIPFKDEEIKAWRGPLTNGSAVPLTQTVLSAESMLLPVHMLVANSSFKLLPGYTASRVRPL